LSVLNVNNVSHGFGDRTIFTDVSFRLLKGEHVALMGANGEGKSTFLNIITGHLQPDEGTVEWSNRVKVGYMDQHTSLMPGKTMRDVLRDAFKYLFDMEQELIEIGEKMAEADEKELQRLLDDMGDIQDILDHSGFYTIDSKINEVANGLGLGNIGLEKEVQDLSGGQRTKVLLAKLLLENPTILILDEPTNYLDVEHIEWLTRYLQNYENAFILVSHEIGFINDVVNIIYHVVNATLTRYVGNYDEFMRLYEVSKQQHTNAYERQKQEIAELEDFIARNKARFSTSSRAKSRQKKLDKMDILEKPKEKIKPEFRFIEARTPSRYIVDSEKLEIGYEEPLTRPLDVKIERGQKIALCGCNGLGKSTLLKTILGIIPPVSGVIEHGDFLEVGYFEQEGQKNNYNTAIEEVWKDYPSLTQYEVRRALAKCGLKTEHIESKICVLSGGEQAKVRLCKLMLKQCNFLVLDEPTNHLDVDAKEELKKALKEFKGTMLLVCHEPDFYADWIGAEWNVENWTNKIL